MWSKCVVLLFSCFICNKWYSCKLYIIRYVQIIGIKKNFTACLRMWPNRGIMIRIYARAGDKWYSIAAISLIGHMTSLELYESPDSVMEAVQKYPRLRLAACSPDKLLYSPNLRRLHLCGDRLSPEGTDGRTVYQTVVLVSFARLRAFLTRRLQTNWLKFEDGFSIICNSLYQLPTLLLHANIGRFPNASMSSKHRA